MGRCGKSSARTFGGDRRIGRSRQRFSRRPAMLRKGGIGGPICGALAALVLLGNGGSTAASYGHHRDLAYRRQGALSLRPRRFLHTRQIMAQVLGGYASPYDLLDPVTGAICNPRQLFPREIQSCQPLAWWERRALQKYRYQSYRQNRLARRWSGA